MKIKMVETIEDSFAFPAIDVESGKLSLGYDVRKFLAGQEYDLTDVHPDWERRAQGFIKSGYSVAV